MKQQTKERLIFPAVSLRNDRRPRWSVNVTLPTDIDAEIRRYVEEDELTSWTVMIHSALYIYRSQLWTQEELDAEFREAIEESIRSAEEKGTIPVTPQFWRDMKKRCRVNMERIRELRAKGKLGNLLLPKELYEFVLERIDSGECKTPADVVCAAMPALRREREKEKRARLRKPREPNVLKVIGTESKRKGTNALRSDQIDRIIRKARKRKQKPQRSARRV
jgi:Arc/MetJ-type ribon-helix-helix transcriptional regulator